MLFIMIFVGEVGRLYVVPDIVRGCPPGVRV